MSNKASLTNTELEATQRVQTHFPRGFSTEVLGAINGCPVESLTGAIEEMVTKLASSLKVVAKKVLQILKIDYRLSLKEMICAGNYNWTNNSITPEQFPITGNGTEEVEYKLFHFNRYISSESADKAIVKEDVDNPWQSAGTEHILAFGAQNPEEQCKYPIVALKAVGEVSGLCHVVCLCRNGAKRSLRLVYWDVGWNANYRFLAVRKLQKSGS